MNESGWTRVKDLNYIYATSLFIISYGVSLVNEVFVRAYNMGFANLQWILPLDGRMTSLGAPIELVSGFAMIVAGVLIRSKRAKGVWFLGFATISYSIGLFLDEIAFGQAQMNMKIKSFEFISEPAYVALILGIFALFVVHGFLRIRGGGLQ